MREAEECVIGYIINSVWQLPLLLAAAWMAARLLRSAGPQAEHRVWVGALVAAPLLPACDLQRLRWIGDAWRHADSAVLGSTRSVMTLAGADRVGALRVSTSVGHALLAVYGLVLLYLCVRLTWGLMQSAALERRSTAIRLNDEDQTVWRRLCRRFDVEDAEIAETAGITGPFTLGMRRRVLLVPPGFLERADAGDRGAALAHELAHIERRDYAKNLLYQFISLPVAFHPALWVLRARVAESRELVCDELAAVALGAGREYAHSLLRLASMIGDHTPVETIHAIGIFDANILERRVMNLIRAKSETKRAVRLASWAACGLLGVAACGTAVALRMEVKSATTAPKSSDHQAKSGTEFVAPKLMLHRMPEYPAEAKADKVTGNVAVGMTIGEDGRPTALHIVKSLRSDVDQSALDALKDWRYSPATHGGIPVPVEVTVQVSFSLNP